MLTGDVAEPLLAAVRRAGLDSVEGAFAYEGGADLVKPGLGHRRRTRIELTDDEGRSHVLYLKRYGKTAMSGGVRRWIDHGRRASAARIEFDNIRLARQAGVPTMREVACTGASNRSTSSTAGTASFGSALRAASCSG